MAAPRLLADEFGLELVWLVDKWPVPLFIEHFRFAGGTLGERGSIDILLDQKPWRGDLSRLSHWLLNDREVKPGIYLALLPDSKQQIGYISVERSDGGT